MLRRRAVVLAALGLAASPLRGCSRPATSATAKARPKVVVIGLKAARIAELRAAAPGVEIVSASDMDAASAVIGEAEALIGRPTPELLRRAPKLRWVQVYSSGVDPYRFPELVDSEITLTNCRVVQGPNVADQALALLLGLTRGLPTAIRQQDARVWSREPFRDPEPKLIELRGKTAAIVGYGSIGGEIGDRVRGFGMKVIGVDRRGGAPPPGVEVMYASDQLHAALARADVVFVAVPLTAQTEGMIDAAALAKIPAGGYLINIARGKVIDTDALVEALASGHLAGAGLDVTEPEPLPPEHPLWALDNVIITPHLGGTSDQVWERRMALIADNLRRFAGGEALVNVVDKRAGY
jgi:phosphoglycerate dehydrogenase-like enzyme